MGIVILQKGDLKKTTTFLKKANRFEIRDILEKYGREGVKALSSYTPIDSGVTANSWDYQIHQSHGQSSIEFINTNVNKGVNIAIILQYGHGTGTGGYVEGRDYINPALRPIFDDIADAAWREVTNA